MTKSTEGMELKWLDIEALVAEIEELSMQYKLIQSRLALSRQILMAYREYTVTTSGSAEPQRRYLFSRKHQERIAQDSSDLKNDNLVRSDEGSLDNQDHDIDTQSSTPSSSMSQSRGDLFFKVLREHPEEPQHFKEIFEMMKSFDPSIDWKNPAGNLRTIAYLMRKRGDERIESLGNGYYKVAQQEQNDESKKHE